MAKIRIDQLMVQKGLAENRNKAQALVLAGQVLAAGQRVDKPGTRVDADCELRLLGQLAFVSRAGGKLEAAIDHFGIPVQGRVCADFGASTGGFTDCLLQRGARSVRAFDVGKGQIAWKLRCDPRVEVRDGFNVRYVTAADLPPEISLVTLDLSFISLEKVLGPLAAALAGKGAAPVAVVALVKPQFEVGKGVVGKGGIVRDPEARARAVAAVSEFAADAGFKVMGSMRSPITGASGNEEFLLYLLFPAGLTSSR